MTGVPLRGDEDKFTSLCCSRVHIWTVPCRTAIMAYSVRNHKMPACTIKSVSMYCRQERIGVNHGQQHGSRTMTSQLCAILISTSLSMLITVSHACLFVTLATRANIRLNSTKHSAQTNRHSARLRVATEVVFVATAEAIQLRF